MNHKKLESKIYELTNNKDIFIKETKSELTIWACTDKSELYTIHIHIWLNDTIATIRTYQLNFYIRRNGIGTKFYQIVEEYLKYWDYKEIQLHLVLTGAETFWTRLGFIKYENIWKKYTYEN
jgi:hypothetical protein